MTNTPAFAKIEDWVALSGIGRSVTYYMISEGKLRAIKAGKRTLIDVEHGLAYMRSQPAAELSCARPRKLPALAVGA